MEKVIIIGGGPAGYTAGIYAARAELKPLIIEGSQYGGQLMETTIVENFPGYPNGISGQELMENMRKQAEKFGARLISEDVTMVDFSKRPFGVFCGEKKYEAMAVVIAVGAGHTKLSIGNEKRLIGKGVSYCATCDGYFFKDKDVIVIGGGDSAMEEAIVLTKHAASVKVIHRRDCLRASKIMQERAFANKKISFVWDSAVVDILGKDKVEGVRIKNLKINKESTIKCHGVFVAIGHMPNSSLFEDHIKMDEKGYIITEQKTTKTSVEGVFACGDVLDWGYRQASAAVGTGCMAAIDVERYLQALNDKKGVKGAGKDKC